MLEVSAMLFRRWILCPLKLGLQTKDILNPRSMHIDPVKVSFNGFAILFKILSENCETAQLSKLKNLRLAYNAWISRRITLWADWGVRGQLGESGISPSQVFIHSFFPTLGVVFIKLLKIQVVLVIKKSCVHIFSLFSNSNFTWIASTNKFLSNTKYIDLRLVIVWTF